MQTTLSAVCAVLVLAGCAHELTSDERLDRDTQSLKVGSTIDAKELAKVNCADGAAGLAKARSEKAGENERLTTYMDLYGSLKRRTHTFEEAFARNPDLAYQDGSAQFVSAKELCVQETADVRLEFDRYVRDMVETPTVAEVKGGTSVQVARLDFATLKHAIELLDPDDKDHLLTRVANAEKRVGNTETTARRRR